MRNTYLEIPAGALRTAGTVMLDWNISSRLANVHRRQAAFEPINLNAAEMDRLRNLVTALPADVEVLGAFGAAEPETRRGHVAADVDRYNLRTDVASAYLAQEPDYLLHLLDGGKSGGLVIESPPDEVPYQPDAFRSWFMVSYAVLLKAVVLDCEKGLDRVERVDRFRFWLEYELRLSASREAWIGFQLLAGAGDRPDRARRLLKLGRRGGVRDAVWGATWDLMYTRIPAIMAQPMFRGNWKLPLVFVTDDAALVDVLAGMRTRFIVENDRGVAFSGDEIDVSQLHKDVQLLVRSYIRREGERVFGSSQGLTKTAMKRAAYLARGLEARLRFVHEAN